MRRLLQGSLPIGLALWPSDGCVFGAAAISSLVGLRTAGLTVLVAWIGCVGYSLVSSGFKNINSTETTTEA